MPPPTIRGGSIMFVGRPSVRPSVRSSVRPSVVRPLKTISRDAMSLYIVQRFQWHLPQ